MLSAVTAVCCFEESGILVTWLCFYSLIIHERIRSTSFPGLQCEDEARHEEALVWASLGRSRDDKKWQYLTATRQGVARYSLMKYTSLRNK